MAVTFVNASNVQPIVNQEVAVATLAGPLDILDAYVSGGAWADGTIKFFIYATVGALRSKVAIGIYGGPTAARITWVDPSGTTIDGSVHAGGTIYDLVVFAQPNQSYQPARPAPLNATFAGVNESDVVADNNTSGSAVAAFGGDATVTTAAGFNQLADVAASMQGAPGILFKLYASCGGGSVEALVASAQSGGPDAIASILREVVLPAATQYRLAVALAQPGDSISVTASLATYLQAGAGGGGGGGVSPGTPGQFLQTKAGPAIAWGQGLTVPLEFFGPTGTADDSPTLQAAITQVTAGTLYRQGLTILITKPSTFASAVLIEKFCNVLFGPGDWTFTASWTFNKGECSIEGAGVGQTNIHLNIAPTGDPTQAAFVGQPGLGSIKSSTTINLINTIGTSVLRFASVAGLAVGDWFTVADTVSGSSFQGNLYKVVAIGAGNPNNVTVDRPVKYQFGVGDHVDVFNFIVENAIVGNMSIDGVGERFVEITIAYNCLVHDVEMTPHAGFDILSIAASYDVFGFRNKFERCTVRGGGLVNSGFALETQDCSEIVDCLSENTPANAFEMLDCATCSFRESRAFNCGSGFVLTADGNVIGCVDCEIHACAAEGGSVSGISVVNGSRGSRVSNCDARYNAANVSLGASDRTFISDVRADHATTTDGLVVSGAGAVLVDNIDVSDCARYGAIFAGAQNSVVQGLKCLGTTVTSCIIITGGTVHVDGFDVSTTNAIPVVRSDGGTLILENGSIASTTGGALGLYTTAAGSYVSCKDVDISTDPAAGQCVRADAGTILLDAVRALTGNIGLLSNGGAIHADSSVNASGTAIPVAITAGSTCENIPVQSQRGAAASGGGTFVATLNSQAPAPLRLPSSGTYHVRASVKMVGGAPVSDSAGFDTECIVMIVAGVASLPAAIAPSANPSTSLAASTAGFIGGGPTPPSAVFAIVGGNLNLTVTNPGAVNATVSIDFDVKAVN